MTDHVEKVTLWLKTDISDYGGDPLAKDIAAKLGIDHNQILEFDDLSVLSHDDLMTAYLKALHEVRGEEWFLARTYSSSWWRTLLEKQREATMYAAELDARHGDSWHEEADSRQAAEYPGDTEEAFQAALRQADMEESGLTEEEYEAREAAFQAGPSDDDETAGHDPE